jgi:hypothetical protein
MVVLWRLSESQNVTPYYEDAFVTLYHGDSRDVLPALLGPGATLLDGGPFGGVVFDPPWDDADLLNWVWDCGLDVADSNFDELIPWPFLVSTSTLVFTDARRLGDAVSVFGSPAWCFTWDTMSPWQTGPRRPLQQTKQCLWYGDVDTYRRDATLWGDAPDARNHPSTVQTPLAGRRLTDLWRESLRWLHHPGAGSGSTGTARFSERRGDDVMRHAKPVGWLRCLIGNCSDGLVLDPFAGSGAALRAAKDLGRHAIGVEIDERACEHIVRSLAQEVIAADYSKEGFA